MYKKHIFLVLLCFFLLTTTVTISQEKVIALEFNHGSSDYFFNSGSSSPSSINFIRNGTSKNNGWLNFNSTESALTFNNITEILPHLDFSENAQKKGYTITLKIKTNNIATDEEQIFWAKGAQGTPFENKIIYGFKKVKNKLVFQRYAKYSDDGTTPSKIVGIWDFELWNSEQFDDSITEYIIMIGVTENIFRVKVYNTALTSSIPTQSYTIDYEKITPQNCNCELVYLGGQQLLANEISSMGFGSPNATISSIVALDYFRIYNRILTFSQMDNLYLDPTIYDAPNPQSPRLISPNSSEKKPTKEPEIIIFPNPIKEDKMLFIQLNSEKEEQIIVQIFDSKGQLIAVQNPSIDQINTQIPVNLKSLSKGMYILNVIRTNTHTSYKFIVE